ncbi:unnamed protein product [Allacma fusca]|uniref:Arrestin C-terminal-like domain-containing protein n=1 Tax=Allacma fusca TaxID=39272 RepID=A0A8J2NLB4_9HEXA|nr:unnamed protein product [Allacma fusca]
MSSSFELFSILINGNSSGIFFPGDIISGYVFKLSSRIVTKNVNITCRGKAVVSLDGNDFSGSARLRFKGIQYLLPATTKEEFFLLSTVCLDEYMNMNLGMEDEEDESISRISRPLLFQFHLRLPKVLPPSCNLHYGFTVYDIMFEWQAWKPETDEWEHKVKHIPISIGASVNLNEIPFAGEPAEATRHEKFSFFCLSFGSIDVNLSVNKMGYTPGEQLNFKVHTNNETKFDVEKITVSLKQERIFYVGELKKKFSKLLAVCDGPRVPQGECQLWEDFMIVPEIQWKFFWPCSLIKVVFYLQVKLTTYKNSCNTPETILENSVNILIGDVPVDPEIYYENFCTAMGIRELDTIYEPERLWLGIDCLSRGIIAHRAQRHVFGANSVQVSMDDSIPSYSSVVSCSHIGSSSRPVHGLESPPPSYQEAMRFLRKPLEYRTEENEDNCGHSEDVV